MNRIFMIGQNEQLSIIDELINVLDVAVKDTRIIKFYNIKNMKVQDILTKLNEFDILSSSKSTPPKSDEAKNNTTSKRKPIVLIIDSTNQLLVKAMQEQHIQIQEFLNYFDVSPEDLRILQYYQINYVDAELVKKKLEELNIIGMDSITSIDKTENSSKTNSQKGDFSILKTKPEVVVNESTNSLFINALAEQHEKITTIISLIDVKKVEKELSYKIYPLENSYPEHVARLLEKLVIKNLRDEEDKIQDISNNNDQIMVVPDPNTFSLIVHATHKDHEWIKELTKSLDKRRPQVLIDVTLVEVTRTDTFEYDLNVIANAKDYVTGNIAIPPLQSSVNSSILEGGFNILDSDGNPTGQTKAF